MFISEEIKLLLTHFFYFPHYIWVILPRTIKYAARKKTRAQTLQTGRIHTSKRSLAARLSMITAKVVAKTAEVWTPNSSAYLSSCCISTLCCSQAAVRSGLKQLPRAWGRSGSSPAPREGAAISGEERRPLLLWGKASRRQDSGFPFPESTWPFLPNRSKVRFVVAAAGWIVSMPVWC